MTESRHRAVLIHAVRNEEGDEAADRAEAGLEPTANGWRRAMPTTRAEGLGCRQPGLASTGVPAVSSRTASESDPRYGGCRR